MMTMRRTIFLFFQYDLITNNYHKFVIFIIVILKIKLMIILIN